MRPVPPRLEAAGTGFVVRLDGAVMMAQAIDNFCPTAGSRRDGFVVRLDGTVMMAQAIDNFCPTAGSRRDGFVGLLVMLDFMNR